MSSVIGSIWPNSNRKFQVVNLTTWEIVRTRCFPKGKIFPLEIMYHQIIRLKFHVLKLSTWAEGEISVLQEDKMSSWKKCINAYTDSPFRSISERAFSFFLNNFFWNGCTIWASQWEQVKGKTFAVPWQPNILTRYHSSQICKSDFCTLVFFLTFRYHIREGRRKPWRKSSSCCWRFWCVRR